MYGAYKVHFDITKYMVIYSVYIRFWPTLHTHAHAHTQKHMHTHKHARTHAHTHTHTHTQEDDFGAPSFLFESVVNGDQQGRYSFVGAMPALEVRVCIWVWCVCCVCVRDCVCMYMYMYVYKCVCVWTSVYMSKSL